MNLNEMLPIQTKRRRYVARTYHFNMTKPYIKTFDHPHTNHNHDGCVVQHLYNMNAVHNII